MKICAVLVVSLAVGCLCACASEPFRIASDATQFAFRTAKLAMGYTSAEDLRAELASGTARGFSADFNGPVVVAVLEVFSDYGFSVVTQDEVGSRSLIVGLSDPSLFGFGELIGVAVEPVGSGMLRATVVSREQFSIGMGKDWSSDILAGIKAKLMVRAAEIVPSATDALPATTEAVWLDQIEAMVRDAFASEANVALVVACEGKDGDYLADRIVARLGTSVLSVRVVASGRDLDRVLREQEKAVSGVYDEETTVRVGRLKGARYAFFGTPYVKRGRGEVELSCRILDIESGVYRNAGRMVTLPLSELPE